MTRKPGRPRRTGGARRGRGRKPSFQAETLDLTVSAIGAQGDGVAEQAGRRFYIPLTVPGDQVRVVTTGPQGDGTAAVIEEILTPGPDRVDPPCPHVGACGGCALQQLSPTAYQAWKHDKVVQALSRRGLGGVAVAPLITIQPGERRRVAWAADRSGHVGFTARRGRDVISPDRCLLLNEALNTLHGQVSSLAQRLAGITKVQATVVDEGVDMVLTGPQSLSLQDREMLADFAGQVDLARLSWAADDADLPQTVAERHAPHVSLSGVPVPFPSGAFLQPGPAGEAALCKLVTDNLDSVKTVVDLFAGLGTFTLGILSATDANVLAVESDVTALRGLEQGAGRAGLGGRCRTETRDLFSRPLAGKELDGVDVVVFDPPRAGAAAQAQALADAGQLQTVIAVSCNPATFARDVRSLVDGGFQVQCVTPVDQFPYSTHLEVVGVLRRD